MRIEILKGVISFFLTIVIIILSNFNTPLESYTNTTSLLFSNKELIMIILIFIVFILKNVKLSTILYSSRNLTSSYLFFFINNICINILLILMLQATNKVSLIITCLLVLGEFISGICYLIAGGYVKNVQFNNKAIRAKEFLGLITIMVLVIDGMPFALSSWPVSTILLIVYVLYLLNLTFNNLVALINEL